MDDWKEKYFASLEALEDKEKEWSETDQLLRRCMSRISLVGDGRDSKIDELLERLRNTIRHEKKYSRIENMVSAIVELTSDMNKQEAAKLSGEELLLKLVKDISFSAHVAGSVRALRKKLEYSRKNNSISELADSFMGIVAESIQVKETSATADSAQKQKKGLFGGLFGGRHDSSGIKAEAGRSTNHSTHVAATGDDPLAMVREVLEELLTKTGLARNAAPLRARIRKLDARSELQNLLTDIALLMKSRTSNAAEKPQAEQTPASSDEISEEEQASPNIEINEILIQLVERLELPEELNARADALKEKWGKGVSEDEIVAAIEAIADLIIAIRTRIERDKNEMQQFLQQVNVRLQELDQHIQDDAEYRKVSFEENKEFGDSVDGQVRQLHTDVQDATDLDELKIKIDKELETITFHLEGFRAKEEQRKERMLDRMELLASKVDELESESEDLRDKIIEDQKLAMRDALTGIPNRLAWDVRVKQEYSRWRRYKSSLVLVVWDVDDFKKINDTYGHKAGDKVLVTIATVLYDNIRETDFIARFGGEEFVLLLPETSMENASAVAEKLRKAIADCQFHHGEQQVQITVSAGLTEFISGDSVESAFERADQYMYKAKRSGKNRCLGDKYN